MIKNILMKRFLFFLLIIVPTFVNAQIEHVEFMGIPINGNITKFKKQLVKKFKKEKIGFTSNITKYYKKGKIRFQNRSIKLKDFSNSLSDEGYSLSKIQNIDCRGKEVGLIIYYDTKSGYVYSVRMDVVAENEEDMHRLFNKYRNTMINEYDYGYPYDFTADGGFNCFLQKIPNSRGTKKIGIAKIYENKNTLFGYCIQIYYWDDINSRKYDTDYGF